MASRLIAGIAVAAVTLTGAAQAAPVLNAGTGNWYDLVLFGSGPQLNWSQAEAAAQASTHLGMTGHLATVTSAAENTFLVSTFVGSAGSFLGAWLGGQVDGANQAFWATGPETGLVFANGAAPLFGQYANFGGIEPNNSPSAIYMNIGSLFSGIGTGSWADAANGNPSSGDPLIGYFIEYEGNAVPEAAAFALFGLGLAGLGIAARRRRAH